MFWTCSVEKHGWVKSVVSWGILLWLMTFHTIQCPPIGKKRGERNPDPAWIGMVKPDLCSLFLKFALGFLVGPPWNPRYGYFEILKPQFLEPLFLVLVAQVSTSLMLGWTLWRSTMHDRGRLLLLVRCESPYFTKINTNAIWWFVQNWSSNWKQNGGKAGWLRT